MKVSVGDFFKVHVVMDRFDYGLVEAMVTEVHGMARFATLAVYVRRNLRSPLLRMEVSVSLSALESPEDQAGRAIAS